MSDLICNIEGSGKIQWSDCLSNGCYLESKLLMRLREGELDKLKVKKTNRFLVILILDIEANALSVGYVFFCCSSFFEFSSNYIYCGFRKTMRMQFSFLVDMSADV